MNASPPVSHETRYRLLNHLAAQPETTQRELARALGISLGKANYCLRALVAKGLLKVRNFGESRNKAAYAYVLTPSGVKEKIRVTREFLRRKIEEHERLTQEIDALRAEVGRQTE
ncbi:MAG: MarR family EPS-associated transcriptional regulator [Acidobacteriota bacterium]